MKHFLVIFLLVALLLSACGTERAEPTDAQVSPTVSTAPSPEPTEAATEAPTEPTQEVTEAPTEPSALSIIGEWLDQELSYTVYSEYMHLAYNGFSHEIRQETALDKSFHFIDIQRQWDHTNDAEYSSQMEYYYQYEGSNYVCYMKKDDQPGERYVYAAGQEQSLFDSRYLMVGSEVLLPSYLQDFSLSEEAAETGNRVCTFSLPLQSVMKNGSLLSNFIDVSFQFYGTEYDPSLELNLYCTLEVEPETLRPVSLTYNFDELKPYILSSGALSGEYAFNIDLVRFAYTFDYNLAETTSIPAEFLP